MSFCREKWLTDLGLRATLFITSKSSVSILFILIRFCLVQLYLPPDCMLNKDFLREVLSEQKKLLELNQVSWIEVPKYEELSVKALYPKFEAD